MTLSNGTGVITSRGLSINSYVILNNESLEFKKFIVTDNTDPSDYTVMTTPSGTFDNVLMEELLDSSSSSYIGSYKVYDGDVQDNGVYTTSGSTTSIPINLSIPAAGISTDADLKCVYVGVKDNEIDCVLKVSSLSTFVEGNTITSSTSTGIIHRIYSYNSGAEYRLYIKSASATPFAVGQTITNGTGGSATISAVVSELVVDVASSASFTQGETVTNATGSSAVIYAKQTGKLVLKDTTGDFDVADILTGVSSGASEAITSTSDSIDTSTVYFTGFFAYDTTGPSIETIKFIANGTDVNFPINLTRTTGMPTNVTFQDTRAVEIFQHNNLPSSHNDYLIRRDGTNSPTSDIDWDSNKITTIANGTLVDDVVAMNQVRTTSDFTTSYSISSISSLSTLLLETLPKRIDHDITITLTANLNISGGVFPLYYYYPIIFEGFYGSGSIIFDMDDFNILQGLGSSSADQECIVVRGCSIPITIINTGTGTSTISSTSKTFDSAIKVNNCTRAILIENISINLASSANYLASVKVVGSSNVTVYNCTLDSGRYGILSANNSTVLSNTNVNSVSSVYGLFATNNSTIIKSGTQPTGSSQDEKCTRGGLITEDIDIENEGMSAGSAPLVLTGTGSPVGLTTPVKIGDIFINTSAGDVYISTGLTSADWVQLN